MPETSHSYKNLAAGFSMAMLLSLTGCGGIDGVELQGGVFDAMGLSGSNKPKLAETKVEARPGLVLPPTPDRLPEPVTGSINPVSPGEAWPVDPEDRKQQARADLEKRHKAFCETAIQDARMRRETGVIMGPAGNCQPGLFGSLVKQ